MVCTTFAGKTKTNENDVDVNFYPIAIGGNSIYQLARVVFAALGRIMEIDCHSTAGGLVLAAVRKLLPPDRPTAYDAGDSSL